MNIEPMTKPKTRAEFEHRFFILIEKLRAGMYHSPFPGGLDKVRSLPNGRIDMLSVNESARLQANTMAHFDSEKLSDLIDGDNKQT